MPGRFEVRAASKQTHPHAAWADYERARQALEHLGFRFLADVDVVSVSLDPGTSRPTVLRLFVSHDGTAVAGFYRMALRWTLGGIMGRLMGGARGIVDVSTAFGDGTVLETSSAPLVGRWASPPFLLREYQPQMHPAALVARHLQRVAEQVEWNPASRPVRVSTLDEVVAIANVLERRKRAFRESIGWITRDELEKHGAKGPQLDTLHAAVRRIVAEEAAAAAASAPPQAPPAAPSAAEWAAAARSSSAAIQPFADPAPPVGMVEHLATGPWIDTDELPSSASTPALSPSSQAEQHPIDLRDSADVHPAMDTDARTEASADPGIDPE
ncbi:MAG TPA: hypothetical protein VEX86_14290, partial [Longimicrobium sp.]|nr:hypothetical protein [Longimicrobium sp.]